MPCQVYSACICCYSACNVKDMMIGCKETGECLCIESKACLGIGEPFPIGMIKEDGFICKIGLPCCTTGLLMPKVLCLSAAQCLCIKSAASFPFKDPVPGPICAVCCIQCMPNVGIMKPPMKVTSKVEGGGPLAPAEMVR